MRHGRNTKIITLTVDLQTGKYSVIKPAGKETLDQNTVSHEESKLEHLHHNLFITLLLGSVA